MGEPENGFPQPALEACASANRRLRRHDRKTLRRMQASVPIALVAGAWLLSMGVIEIMEVPRPVEVEPAAPEPAALLDDMPAEDTAALRPMLAPDPAPDLDGVLGVSLLDEDVQATPGKPPLENLEDAPEPDRVPPSVDTGPPARLSPEPGSALLLGLGLAGLARLRSRRSR